MATFESQLGKNRVNGSMREFSVPDQSELDQFADRMQEEDNREQLRQRATQARAQSQSNVSGDVAAEFSEAREQKRKPKISDGSKRRLEHLLGMTRLTKDVKIGELTFVLRTLNDRETREVIKESIKFDGSEELMFELRTQYLARAIVQMKFENVDQMWELSSLEEKLYLVDEFDGVFKSSLYDEYLKLTNEARAKYSLSDIGAKEVIEEIKK